MTAFDAHAHVIVPELLRDGAPQETWRPRIDWRGRHAGRRVRRAGDPLGGPRVRRARGHPGQPGSQGIDGVLLCPWVPLLFYDVPATEALERCRLQNRGLARLRAGHPDRISVLGAVPLQDPELAAAELHTLMETGDFAGVEVTASVGGTYLGDRRFEPFWAAAERADALVFVHPTTRGLRTRRSASGTCGTSSATRWRRRSRPPTWCSTGR